MTIESNFITVEGIDGAGKTTAVSFIEDTVRELTKHIPNHRVIRTREPGGTPVAERIRELVLSLPEASPKVQAALMYAARFEHVDSLIWPALTAGNCTVICDRFTESTWAYQNHDGKLTRFLQEMDKLVDLRPDITFYLDICPDKAAERLQTRNESNAFDAAFLSKARAMKRMFDHRAARKKSRIVTIDADGDVEAVQEQIRGHLMDIYKHDQPKTIGELILDQIHSRSKS